jgi:hypothetical protein
MSKGTPSTVDQAILNACRELHETIPERLSGGPCVGDVEVIKKHVKDFLAQKFNVFTVSEDPVVASVSKHIWETIFKEAA